MRIQQRTLLIGMALGLAFAAASPGGAAELSAPSPAAGPAEVLFPCVADDTTMCLNHGRFRTTANFRTNEGVTGGAHAVPLTDDTGYFWFFSSSNVEIIVKVLNGCGVNQHYWVFAGGLTNVNVIMRVADTTNEGFTQYDNRPNTPYQPVQDTTAFPNCP
ncbi:MAG TPA: hypothetical protein VHR45_17720 [Thermoanaerobaculia bacterium]|nr:hypothetical protein [Thermoanaerobaculia bacterium]